MGDPMARPGSALGLIQGKQKRKTHSTKLKNRDTIS